jgi:hypothetical protein
MSYPGLKFAGQLAQYIGRLNIVQPSGATEHPAADEAVEIDSESDAGKRVIKCMRRDAQDPPLWAADADTARACGVTYVPVEKGADGEFRPAKKSSKKD